MMFLSVIDTTTFKGLAESNVLLERFSTFGLGGASVQARVFIWRAGIEAFVDRPVFGWGSDNYIVVFGRYIDEEDSRRVTHDRAHNKPLEELTTKGFFGFASYSTLWVFMFVAVFRRAKEQRYGEQAFTLFIGAALTGYFIQNLFLFDTPATILQLVLLIAYAINLETNFSERTEPERVKGSRADNEARPDWKERIMGLIPALKWLRGSAQASILKSNTVALGGVFIALGLVAFSLYFANYRAYVGASSILNINRPTNTFDQTIEYFEQSIESFEPLANYPRLILFTNIANNWDLLTESQARQALEVVEREAQRAIESEPENWRLYVEIARVYQKAAALDLKYQELSDSYLNTAKKLAPAQSEVLELILNPQ